MEAKASISVGGNCAPGRGGLCAMLSPMPPPKTLNTSWNCSYMQSFHEPRRTPVKRAVVYLTEIDFVLFRVIIAFDRRTLRSWFLFWLFLW